MSGCLRGSQTFSDGIYLDVVRSEYLEIFKTVRDPAEEKGLTRASGLMLAKASNRTQCRREYRLHNQSDLITFEKFDWLLWASVSPPAKQGPHCSQGAWGLSKIQFNLILQGTICNNIPFINTKIHFSEISLDSPAEDKLPSKSLTQLSECLGM